jgi:NhaA family Na+:H+ antiporter
MPKRVGHILQEFLDRESSGGIVLTIAAIAALIAANSGLAPAYFSALDLQVGPLRSAEWINDALMALFFLLVGTEIKRELVGGELSTWRRRALPGIAALGGMIVPALICASINLNGPEAIKGWAIPSATDIAFAIAAISALGDRVPASLKVFLTALAIIDDLGAVLIIAVFYARGLSLPDLAWAVAATLGLVALNRWRVSPLWPYLILGVFLWIFVYRSGLHATLAGVIVAFALPANVSEGSAPPLLRAEKALDRIVPFVIVPIFGIANAGLSFSGIAPDSFSASLPLGIGLGLLVGKPLGVYGSAALAIRLGLAELPSGASKRQLFGVAQLCGIGFTMSLFIGLLAFPGDPDLIAAAKLGILCGSVLAAVCGLSILFAAARR